MLGKDQQLYGNRLKYYIYISLFGTGYCESNAEYISLGFGLEVNLI